MHSLSFRASVVSALAVILALAGATGIPSRTCAAADKEEAASQPIILLNVASVDRWIENVGYVFQTIDRKEIAQAAEGQLSKVNDLKGMDRTRPLGVMMYLEGLVPRAVGYLPVSNIEELQKTLSIGPVTAKKVEGKDGRYELVGGRQTLHVKIQNDYGFVADQPEILDRELPDPTEATKTVTSKYDLALTANLDRIPETTRQILLAAIRSAAEAQLQQRDNEPKGAYLVRRASGMSNMQLLEQVLAHGRSLTLGWDVSPADKRAVIELSIDVRPDSELAQYLAKIDSRPSHFRGLMTESTPFGMSVSWLMDNSRKKMFLEILKAAGERTGANGNAPAENGDGADGTAKKPAFEKILEQLKATVETGHLDLCFQMTSTEKGKFVIAGGLRVADSDAMAAGVLDLVQSLKDGPSMKEVVPDAEVHKGMALHRLVPKQFRAVDKAIYGEESSILLGAGANAVWFSFGGSDAGNALKQMIDVVSDTGRATPEVSTAPFRMVVNGERWTALTGEEGARPAPFRGLAKQALSEENDAVRVEFRPAENGGRLRLEFDEGFLRMIGLGVARRFDRAPQ